MPVRLLFLLVSSAVLLSACRPSRATTAAADSPAIAVKVTPVTREQKPVLIETPALVRPAERAVIAAQLTGTIDRLPWSLGQSVAKGALLIRLASPTTQARVHQAEAQRDEASRAVARERALVARAVSPPESLRTAEDRLRIAQAAVLEAEALLAHTTVIAPFAGVIAEKYVLPGDLASPGQPLLVLEASAHLRAEGTVPASLASRLKIGDSLAVLLEGQTTPVMGTLEELAGTADPATRSVFVKVALPDDTARSGQFARLLVPGEMSPIISVPHSALIRFGQMEQVFIVVDGRATLRLVRTGRALGDRIEITSGLSGEESVITSPGASLRDGTLVTAQP